MKKPKKDLILPDRFVLDKDDVVFVLKSIEKHWKRDNFNALENAAYVANMELIKTAVRLNNSKVLGELYFSIVESVHQIETLNSLKLSLEEFSDDEAQEKSFQQLYDIQKHKIGSGDAFIR